MNNIVQPLLELQEIDSRIRELQQEIRDIPDRKVQESRNLNNAKKDLEKAKANMHEQEVAINASEAEIKAMHERIDQLQQDQGNLKTNAEFKEFSLEITKLTKDVETQERLLLIKQDDLIPLQGRVKEAEAKLEKERAEVEGYLQELDARLAEVEAALKETEAERQAFVANVSPSLLTYYNRLRERRWPILVELLDGGACNGCHLVQPPSKLQQVKLGDKMVTCEMCGRILYYPQV
ncbi:MAG: hypothetical protein IJR99_17085 [Kiritimatiellae bacterium]|nr:hypothetical protein [Kiritimatiellia bacterium]